LLGRILFHVNCSHLVCYGGVYFFGGSGRRPTAEFISAGHACQEKNCLSAKRKANVTK
jgi:hypothetical protein